MNSSNKENINISKRKRTESFDNLNVQPIRKILKLEKGKETYEEDIYFDNKMIGFESMKVFSHNQTNFNVKTSNFFHSINKNDILTIIWKTNFNYNTFVEKSKKISQQFLSKRKDIWDFIILYDPDTRAINLKVNVLEKQSTGK